MAALPQIASKPNTEQHASRGRNRVVPPSGFLNVSRANAHFGSQYLDDNACLFFSRLVRSQDSADVRIVYLTVSTVLLYSG